MDGYGVADREFFTEINTELEMDELEGRLKVYIERVTAETLDFVASLGCITTAPIEEIRDRLHAVEQARDLFHFIYGAEVPDDLRATYDTVICNYSFLLDHVAGIIP